MMEFLRQLAQEDLFPMPVIDEADIDKLRVLRAAGMVQADLPGERGSGPSARLIAITGLGRATLRVQTAHEFIAWRQQMPGTQPPPPWA